MREWKLAILSGALLMTGSASAGSVTVTIENLSPTGGLAFTPVWVGFHDGSFDLFDTGSPASLGLERIAEDGSFSDIATEFSTATGGRGQGGVITAPQGFPGAPVFEPGEVVSRDFRLTPNQRFLSLAAMVLPSNDAFFGTNNAIQLFGSNGQNTGTQTFFVGRSRIYDAGTEANTELDAAFLNQTAPNTGITTVDPIALHPGFINSVQGPAAGPNGEAASILGGTGPGGITFDPVLADFTSSGFQGLARITITPNVQAIPTPSALVAGLAGFGAVALRRRRA